MKSIIVRPIITEKTLSLAEAKNQFTFLVKTGANKIEVKKAVEAAFDVTVKNVRMMNMIGKTVRFGRKRIAGYRGARKKAVVTLKDGDTIEIFNIK